MIIASGRWQNVLGRADRARGSPQVPMVRPRVLAARAEIRDLIAALRTAGPVPAHGVALADVLISDSASPLYSGRSPLDLRASIRAAVRNLDPSASLAAELETPD